MNKNKKINIMIGINLKLIIIILLATMIGKGSIYANDSLLFRKMMKSKNYIFSEAVHPETNLIYNIVDLEDPDHWEKTIFPSPDQIRNKVNNDREVPNLSNCPITGGRFLSILVDCFDVTHDTTCIEQAKIVFNGMQSLANVSLRKGFIARGLLPGDSSKAHFLNSSVDQYTYYVYGLWKYYNSPLSGTEEKQTIRTIINDICTMIAEDNTILATNGIPTRVSDIEAIRSDRSSRMLQMFLAAWDMTGDSNWFNIYRKLLEYNNYARLRTMIDPVKIRYPYFPRDSIINSESALWAHLQSQTSLALLFHVEKELPIKTAYYTAINTYANLARNTTSEGYSDHANQLGKDKNSIESQQIEIILFSENLYFFNKINAENEDANRKVLGKRCYELFSKTSQTDISALSAYWTAVKKGILNINQ